MTLPTQFGGRKLYHANSQRCYWPSAAERSSNHHSILPYVHSSCWFINFMSYCRRRFHDRAHIRDPPRRVQITSRLLMASPREPLTLNPTSDSAVVKWIEISAPCLPERADTRARTTTNTLNPNRTVPGEGPVSQSIAAAFVKWDGSRDDSRSWATVWGVEIPGGMFSRP